MPALKNQRHELFAQELAKGKSATQAYRDAGYKDNMQAASNLCRKVYIQTRVKELQERVAVKVIATVESLAIELDEMRKLAKKNIQISAGVSAIMGKAKLLGLLIDKQELAGKDGGAIEVRSQEIKDAASSFDAKFIEVLAKVGAVGIIEEPNA